MEVIDRYVLEEELGAGGYGRVYRARHQVMGRQVALKVLLAQREQDRFLREAEILAQLDHPNIVRIHDSGVTEDGRAFLALELLEGETLSRRLQTTGPQHIEEAVWIVDGVLAALEAAHAQGVIHRDIKHPNIFLAHQRGEIVVKLLDFGIAKVADAGRLTATGILLGTPRYMAPEMITGMLGDARSDLWSAGLILYEALLGERAYQGTPEEALVAIVSGPPPPLASRAPHLPAQLLDVVTTVLSHDPAGRFASATAFRAALAGCLTMRSVRHTTVHEFATGSLDPNDDDGFTTLLTTPVAHPPTAQPVERGSSRRRFALASMLGLVVAALTAVLVVQLLPETNSANPTETAQEVSAPPTSIEMPNDLVSPMSVVPIATLPMAATPTIVVLPQEPDAPRPTMRRHTMMRSNEASVVETSVVEAPAVVPRPTSRPDQLRFVGCRAHAGISRADLSLIERQLGTATIQCPRAHFASSSYVVINIALGRVRDVPGASQCFRQAVTRALGELPHTIRGTLRCEFR